MSRIGKKPIDIPKDVKVEVNGQIVIAQGPKGKSQLNVPFPITVKLAENRLTFSRPNDVKVNKSLHGLARSLVANMVIGVEKGYTKELEIVGVGFRAAVQGNVLTMQLGFTHPVIFPIPEDIQIATPKQTQIKIEGIDKARVGLIAAKIRDVFPPEPYKGKGIRYVGEHVRRKAGKVVAK